MFLCVRVSILCCCNLCIVCVLVSADAYLSSVVACLWCVVCADACVLSLVVTCVECVLARVGICVFLLL